MGFVYHIRSYFYVILLKSGFFKKQIILIQLYTYLYTSANLELGEVHLDTQVAGSPHHHPKRHRPGCQ